VGIIGYFTFDLAIKIFISLSGFCLLGDSYLLAVPRNQERLAVLTSWVAADARKLQNWRGGCYNQACSERILWLLGMALDQLRSVKGAENS